MNRSRLVVAILPALTAACGAAPAAVPSGFAVAKDAAASPVVEERMPFLAEEPPAGTIALGRASLAISSLREELSGPVATLADECDLDGRIDRIDAAITGDLGVAVEITGTLDPRAVKCVADSRLEGVLVLRTAPDRLVVALPAPAKKKKKSSPASPSPPAATASLVDDILRLSETSPIAFVARRGPLAVQVTGDTDRVEARVRLPPGQAEAAVSWWEGPARAALGSPPVSDAQVRADGADLVVDVSLTDEMSSIALALRIRMFALEAFHIPSGSMFPTLHYGDHLFVDKTPRPPKRGDIAVFESPEDPGARYIKRIVAMPGETVEVVDGRIVVGHKSAVHCAVGRYEATGPDGSASAPLELFVEKLDGRAYLIAREVGRPSRSCGSSAVCEPGEACREGRCAIVQGPYQVPPGEVFMVGDNRDNSHDSRSFAQGSGRGVPVSSLLGRAGVIYLPDSPGAGVDFDRIFTDVAGKPVLPTDASSTVREAFERCLAAP